MEILVPKGQEYYLGFVHVKFDAHTLCSLGEISEKPSQKFSIFTISKGLQEMLYTSMDQGIKPVL